MILEFLVVSKDLQRFIRISLFLQWCTKFDKRSDENFDWFLKISYGKFEGNQKEVSLKLDKLTLERSKKILNSSSEI